MKVFAAALAALALAAPAYSAPQYHSNLGDDSLESEPRDIPGEADAALAPAAAVAQDGCLTDLIQTNFSSRSGARPNLFVLHLTVSRNSAGWGDVNAIRNFFNQPATDASSNYVIDAEGNCKLIVAETAKAWTQGSFNPVAISIEFIHFSTTNPSEVWTEAQLRKGARVVADATKRWGIPVRLTNPSQCPPVLAGVTDHDRLECRNTHVDVGTKETGTGVHPGTFPMTKFLEYVRAAQAPPVEIVHFVLANGEGVGIAKSMGVQSGSREINRLRGFLGFRAPAMLRELREDGDVNILRKKGRP